MLPYPYQVFAPVGPSGGSYYVIEMWNPEFKKYVIGYVFNGMFRACNEHLLKRELAESWEDIR